MKKVDIVPDKPAYSSMIYTSENIKFCPDGKYRWVYEFNMYKNPSILFVVLKIFGFLLLIPCFFIFYPLLKGETWEHVYDNSKYAMLTFGIFFICIFVGYWIYAAMCGGKYVVMFEMDEDGVLHRAMKNNVKKAKAISNLLILAGLLSGNPSRVGAGLITATHTSSYSTFSSVRKVKAFRRRNLIKVNELLYHNQVYVADEDFDFVYEYISTRCPKLKRWRRASNVDTNL